MPIEFIGMIGVKPEGADGAAVHVIGGEIDLGWIRDFSRAHESAGFDKVLVGYTSTAAEGFVVAGYAAAHTERLAYLIAHRPGFVAVEHPGDVAVLVELVLDHVGVGELGEGEDVDGGGVDPGRGEQLLGGEVSLPHPGSPWWLPRPR